MKSKDIPIAAIIACFIFGAWPIGVVLIVLKVIKESEEEEKRNAAKKKNDTKRTVYHSGYTGDKTAEELKNSYFYNEFRAAAENKASESAEPDTTYHYSYVKKDARTEVPAKTTAPKTVNYVNTKFRRSGTQVTMNVFMWIGLAISAILFLGTVISVAGGGFLGNIDSVVTTMAFSTVTAGFYLLKEYYKSRDYRIVTYLSLLRKQRYYSVEKLADVADVSVSRTMKDLHYMQSKGLLGDEAIIDKKIRYLVLTPSARDEAKAEAERESTTPRREARRREEGKNEVTTHEETLARIRELNDDIDDAVVSEKIDTIEELTRKIFNLVEEKPTLRPQLDSFLSYYLPTTLKLLDSYAYFEEQGVRGENIDAGMKNIEETLDMLIVGYRTQLDKLFQSQAMDVSTDINVLEQMMKADGFTENSDFGFSSSGAFAEMKDTENKNE